MLYSAITSDAMLSLADAGFFAAKWTAEIDDEWVRNLVKKRPELDGKAQTRRDVMRQAIADWEVPEPAWRALVSGLVLPDRGDVHVLAAGIAGHVDCIVTFNLDDFPEDMVGLYGMEVIHPDIFILNQWDLDQTAAIKSFKRMRARRKNPTYTAESFAEAMARAALPLTAQRLREEAELI